MAAVTSSMGSFEEAPADGNRFGKLSELRVRAEARDGRTAVPELFATMPFKVMHPLAVAAGELPGFLPSSESRADNGGAAVEGRDAETGPDDGDAEEGASPAVPAQLMVMSVSAGIMAGDEQRISVDVGPGAALQMTTQAFEKIHRMDDGASARRVTSLAVESGGYLDYKPLPQVPFADSAFTSETRVELADASARLVYGEILSCGRAARGERFAYRRYQNHVEVFVAGEPVFIDNTVYEPTTAGGLENMEGIGFYEGFTHLANLVLVNLAISDEVFEAVRAYLLEQTGVIGAAAALREEVEDPRAVAGGITRLESGDCLVKLLGHRAQRLQDVLDGVRRLL